MKYYSGQFYITKIIIISIIITIFVSVIGLFAYNKIYTELPEDFILFATDFLLAYAVVYAIMVGFIILISFTRYQKFGDIVSQELSCLGDILDFTEYLSRQDASRGQIKDSVKNYGISVANDEWSDMSKGRYHQMATLHLKKLVDSINSIDLTNNNKNTVIFEALINKVANLTTLRASRLEEAKNSFPKLLTLILYVVSVIFILGVFLIFVPNIFFQTLFLSSTVFTVSLIIQLVNDMGNPHKPGVWHVSKKDYETIKMSIVTQISDVGENKKI